MHLPISNLVKTIYKLWGSSDFIRGIGIHSKQANKVCLTNAGEKIMKLNQRH